MPTRPFHSAPLAEMGIDERQHPLRHGDLPGMTVWSGRDHAFQGLAVHRGRKTDGHSNDNLRIGVRVGVHKSRDNIDIPASLNAAARGHDIRHQERDIEPRRRGPWLRSVDERHLPGLVPEHDVVRSEIPVSQHGTSATVGPHAIAASLPTQCRA